MELFKNPNIDFLGRKGIFFALSALLLAGGIGSLATKGGLKYGIDFTGGAAVPVRFATAPPIDKIRSAVSAKIPGEIAVQEVSTEHEVIISTMLDATQDPAAQEKAIQEARGLIVAALNENFADPSGKFDFNNTSAQALAQHLREPFQRAGIGISDQERERLATEMTAFRNTPPRSGLLTSFDQLKEVEGVTPAMLQVISQECSLASFGIRGAEVVGPKIGRELRYKAVLATVYALAGMLIYIGFRFEFIYGAAAVIAVLHDVLITLGLFSLFDKEISLNVVAALLTLVGYSMNDTIVVFDRIRETLKLSRRDSYLKVVNDSINQTLSRTVLTSSLTFITALALLLFGGPVLNGFSFALVAGILVGTYSSIFIASPILVYWQGLIEGRRQARK
jgi:preprotein translocase subunit SecF